MCGTVPRKFATGQIIEHALNSTESILYKDISHSFK